MLTRRASIYARAQNKSVKIKTNMEQITHIVRHMVRGGRYTARSEQWRFILARNCKYYRS